MTEYTVHHSGDESTDAYRVYLEKDGKVISIMHDIPLHAGKDGNEQLFNFVVEIPKGTNAKMEINLNQPGNPIKQDIKKGKLRFVDNVTPYAGYPWNYGAFPQTWEDPYHKHPDTNCFGDNDPLDVCEIGDAVGFRGQVKKVKVLGVIALIDEGETDWKVIVIDVTDPKAKELNDINDVFNKMPGYSYCVYEWLRTYKMPAGKPPNEFAFNGAAKDKAYALNVVAENHEFWKNLVLSDKLGQKGEKHDVACVNLHVEGSPYKGESIEASFADHKSADPCLAVAAITGNAVKCAVETSQRERPHGNSNLSTVVSDCAVAVAGVVLGKGSFDVKDSENYYSIEFNNNTASVYRKSTPHPLPFPSSSAVDGKELIAVVAGSKDGDAAKLLVATGNGVLHAFSTTNGTDFTSQAADASCVSGDCQAAQFLRENAKFST